MGLLMRNPPPAEGLTANSCGDGSTPTESLSPQQLCGFGDSTERQGSPILFESNIVRAAPAPMLRALECQHAEDDRVSQIRPAPL